MLILLALSAVFSGSETALFSLSRARLMSFKNSTSKAERHIAQLVDSYHLTQNFLSLGNTFVNVAIAMLGNRIIAAMALDKTLELILSICFSVFILLIFGEITPKTFGLLFAQKIAAIAATPLLWIIKIAKPVISTLDAICSLILDALGRKQPTPLSPEEYATYLDMAHVNGAFDDKEKRLLTSAINMTYKYLSYILTVIFDFFTKKHDSSAETIAARIRAEKENYYPVTPGDIDNAELILSAKRFFLLTPTERGSWINSKAVFPASFIPENAAVTQALETMNKRHASAALVTDEYGRVSGMLTREDIFAEMIGDIADEHDQPEFQITPLDQHSWRLDGMIPIHTFEEHSGIELNEELESATVNGLFSEKLGRLPVHGDTIRVGNLFFRADRISRHRATIVKAWLEPSPSTKLDSIAGEEA